MNERTRHEAAVLLGRLGGSKATEAQKRAARKNGLLGGRPRKSLHAISCNKIGDKIHTS